MHFNVLIISPTKDAYQALSDKLSPDYHLYAASEWTRSLALINRHPIQLIICIAADNPTPGLLLCRQLKSNPVSAHLPLILLTDQENLQIRIKSLEAGADVHMGGVLFREYLDVQMRSLIGNRIKVRQYLTRKTGDEEVQPDLTKDQIIRKLSNCLFSLGPNDNPGIDRLAKMMHMSKPTLYRKMKLITNLTPNELINEARLRKAAELLAAGAYRVSEVSRMVGYGSPSSFGKSFLKQFKVTPATYQRMRKIMDAA